MLRVCSALSVLCLISCQPQYLTPESGALQDDGARKTDVPAVGSREFKVLLAPELFAGDPSAALDELWNGVKAFAEDELDRDTDGDLQALDKVRTVRFLDVPAVCSLKDRSWVVRERTEGDDREVTVKYRSPDRFLAAHTVPGSGGDLKFEEDVSPGWTSKYSHSNKVPLDDDVTLSSLEDVFDAVDDLDDELVLPGELPLVEIGAVYERRFGPAIVDLGSLDAELTVTLWTETADSKEPVVAEVSFKYEDDDEDYTGKVLERGMALFGHLEGLDDWRDPESLTKTAWIYAQAPELCD